MVDRATPASRATLSTLTGEAGSLVSRSKTASRMRRRVSSADSARSRCSYLRVVMSRQPTFSLDTLSFRIQSVFHATMRLMKERVMRGRRGGQHEQRVLIVGAGPAGLTAAITLARYGVPVLLVERRSELSGLPRATGVSLRTMEIYRSWGIEQELRAGELDVAWTSRAAQTMATLAPGITLPLGYPSREESAR